MAENYGYKPLLARLQAILAAGEIGELRFAHVNAVKRQQVNGWRTEAGAAGGGALFEGGIHWIDFIAHLGPPVRSARGFRSGPGGAGAQQRGGAGVRRRRGGHACSIPGRSPRRCAACACRASTGPQGAVAFESNGLFVAVYGRRKRLHLPGLRDIAGYRAMFADFFAAIGTGREPLMTLSRARRDHELLEAAEQGLQGG